MATVKELYSEVKSILSKDAVLSQYVGRIYDRDRDAPQHNYRAVIMLEPADVIESYFEFPVEASFAMKITGYIYESNPDRSVTDGTVRQILDLENDIKEALRPYHTINGKCLRFRFSGTRFDRKRDSWGKQERLLRPPIYGVEILMSIQFYRTALTAGFGADAFGIQPYGF